MKEEFGGIMCRNRDFRKQDIAVVVQLRLKGGRKRKAAGIAEITLTFHLKKIKPNRILRPEFNLCKITSLKSSV